MLDPQQDPQGLDQNGPPDIALRDGERWLAKLTPRLSVYLLRLVFIAAVWVFVGSGAGFLSQDLWLVILGFTATMLYYIIAFEDGSDWRQRRNDEWWLSNERLVFSNRGNLNGPIFLELAALKTVRVWMFWAVRLHLKNGTKNTIHFINNRRAIRDLIKSTMKDAPDVATS